MRKIVIAAAGAWLVASVSAFGASGSALWSTHCAKCHGADGAGNTAMGKKLKAKDYSKTSVSEAEVAKSIKQGVKQGGKVAMKAFPSLSDDDIKALSAHMQSLKK